MRLIEELSFSMIDAWRGEKLSKSETDSRKLRSSSDSRFHIAVSMRSSMLFDSASEPVSL